MAQPTRYSALYKTALSGAGILSDAYNLFAINLVKNVLKFLYAKKGDFSPADATALSNSELVGAIIGQVLFGLIADRIGRKATFVATISMVIIGCLASMSATAGLSMSLTAQLCLWRGIVGVGVGGEYPLSATVSAEGTTTAGRGRALGLVFAMQGFGNVLSTVVMYILLISPMPIDWVWRAALGIGAVPGLLTLYGRLRMEESHHYKKLSEPKVESSAINPGPEDEATALYVREAERSSSGFAMLRRFLGTLWEWRFMLLGTAGSWFIFDIAYYGQGLFTGQVLADIGLGGGTTSRESLTTVTLGNIVVNCIGLPGYFLGLALVDRLGRCAGVWKALISAAFSHALAVVRRRKRIQLIGFVLVAVIFAVMSAALDPLKSKAPAAFVVLYGLSYLFSNAGPNLSTYVIPAEAFPTAIKATTHGFSAACGKAGAVLGTSIFNPLQQAFGTDAAHEDGPGLQLVLYVCAACALLGAVWTWFFTIETQHHSIEALDAGHKSGNPALLEGGGDDLLQAGLLEKDGLASPITPVATFM